MTEAQKAEIRARLAAGDKDRALERMMEFLTAPEPVAPTPTE